MAVALLRLECNWNGESYINKICRCISKVVELRCLKSCVCQHQSFYVETFKIIGAIFGILKIKPTFFFIITEQKSDKSTLCITLEKKFFKKDLLRKSLHAQREFMSRQDKFFSLLKKKAILII